MKLHAKYLRPGPSNFRQEVFIFFPICVHFEQVIPVAGPLMTKGL